MYLLLACDDGDVLNTIRIVVIIINIIKVIIPIIVMIFAIRDFANVVISGKNEKMSEALKMFVGRLIASLIVFFMPLIVDSFIELVSKDATSYHECIDKATPEGIKQAYYEREKRLIEKARKTLDFVDFRDAESYLARISEESKRKELEAEIEKVRKYMALRTEISAMTKKEQYEPLKGKINAVDDAEVKQKLLDELEAKYKTLHDPPPEKPTSSSTENDPSTITSNVSSNPNMAETGINGEIVRQEETDTLKVVIKKVGSYYVTQIWVADPYNQLNKFDSPNYGQQNLNPGYLLKTAMNQKGLTDKLIVGFNASGFYLKDVYDAASVNYYPAYNKTSVGTLVITDGQVVRNAYDKAYKTWYIAGVDKSGSFNIYVDANTKDANAKKAWSETVIGNIRNTYTFASPLVVNGVASSDNTSMPSPGSSLKRQAMCQIDKNNFMLITGANLNRQNMIDIMLQAKCQTGTNFDGGGSIALLFKSKGSTNIDTIIGNGRALTEVGYFVE